MALRVAKDAPSKQPALCLGLLSLSLSLSLSQEVLPVVTGLQTLRFAGVAYRTNAVPPPANHVAVKRTRRT